MNEENELPVGWVETTLESIASIRDDLRVPVNADERSRRNGEYPYYGATGQVGWIDSYLMDGEYVLLGEDGAPFLDPFKQKAYLVTGKCWVNNHAHVLQAMEGLSDNRFLMYALNFVDYRKVVNGTTRLKLTQSAMRKIPIKFPPFQEQRRIVAAIEQQFTRLDAGVEALKQAQKKLKLYRSAILKAAVEGKLTEDWRDKHPATESATELLKRILKERRAKWEADQLAKMTAKGVVPKDDKWKEGYKEPAQPDIEGLPDLPEGWCWATVEQVSHFVRYGTSAKTSSDSSGVPVLRMGNIQDGVLDFSNLKYLPISHSEFPMLLLDEGDLLFNRTNSAELVGKSAVYRGNFTQCSYASYLICVRMLEGCISDYLCFFLNSLYGREWIASVFTQQAGQANVNGSKLQALSFPLPPLAEQEHIVALVEEQLSFIDELEAEVEASLKRAERERQSILHEAFAGRLVPQDPADEPASVLLERIQKERVEREREEREAKKQRGSKKMTSQRTAKDKQRKPLREVLKEAKQPITPDDLFRRAGFQVNDVDEFFADLRMEVLNGGIKQVRPDDTYVLLEAIGE